MTSSYNVERRAPVRSGGELLLIPVSLYAYPVIRLLLPNGAFL